MRIIPQAPQPPQAKPGPPYPLYIGLGIITIATFIAIIVAIIVNAPNLTNLIIQITGTATMLAGMFTGLYKSVELVHVAVNSQMSEMLELARRETINATVLAATAGLSPGQTAIAVQSVRSASSSQHDRSVTDEAELAAYRLAAQQDAAIVLAAQISPPPPIPVAVVESATQDVKIVGQEEAVPVTIAVPGTDDAELKRLAAQRDAAASGDDG